jgi:hypothetical protein
VAWSFDRPRQLRVSADGKVVFERRIETDKRTYEVPVSFRRTARFALTVSPAATPARETGSRDPRSLSIAVQEPTFVPAR